MADLTSRPDMRDEPALAVAPPREPAAGDGDLPDAAPAPDALLAHESEPREPTTTPSQLRRFIKSRPWVPMHELRRRFGIGASANVLVFSTEGATDPGAYARVVGQR